MVLLILSERFTGKNQKMNKINSGYNSNKKEIMNNLIENNETLLSKLLSATTLKTLLSSLKDKHRP